jgi:hypothetical protein
LWQGGQLRAVFVLARAHAPLRDAVRREARENVREYRVPHEPVMLAAGSVE